MNKVSVVISVYNEEKNIKDCLESVAFADEIIVINSSSTDKTEEIAAKYTKQIFTKPNNAMLNANKNFGFSKAKNDWILSVDADERISPELAKEILSVVSNKEETNGFWIPRKNIIFGKWIEHTGWYPDHQLRLFKKSKGKFPEEHVHEMVSVAGATGYLREHIIHYNYTSIAQFIDKTFRIYAQNEAAQLLKGGYEFNYLDSIRMPSKEFLSRFFAREGYKDGFHGLMLSLLMAFYHLIIFAYIWEKKDFTDAGKENILHDVQEEFGRLAKDTGHWIFSENMKNIKNPVKKTIHKILRKLS